MITKITINNFKKLEHISFEVGSPLVLVGPNNSGKTSILQAITLWEAGIRKWASLNNGGSKNKKQGKRQGISINRKDLISLPIPSAKMLWNQLNTHNVIRENGKQETRQVFLDIKLEGNTHGTEWVGALEFYYANEESLYCRPMRIDEAGVQRYNLPPEALQTRVAYLQPMSGLAAAEDKLTPGSIDRKIGEGKTADVIRNIAYQLLHPERAMDAADEKQIGARWQKIVDAIHRRFGVVIQEPDYNPDNGLLQMKYKEHGILYDLSSSGRGLQQTLLLLCFLYANPGRLILMDEPDAHLEVLRQKEIYNLIADVTRTLGSQLLIASHSEIVLNEAAARQDDIVAILENKAIQLNDQQLTRIFKKSLTEYGWDKYYLAKLKKHVVYVEGGSDVRNLEAFAQLLAHPIQGFIQEANIDHIENNIPSHAFERFKSLKIIEPGLKGICLFDRLQRQSQQDDPIPVLQWHKRELENYFISPEVLIQWAQAQATDLFTVHYPTVMEECIQSVTPPLYLTERSNTWWDNHKLGDWAEDVLALFFKKINQPVSLRKASFYTLIAFVDAAHVPQEIVEKLDAIYEIIKSA